MFFKKNKGETLSGENEQRVVLDCLELQGKRKGKKRNYIRKEKKNKV